MTEYKAPLAFSIFIKSFFAGGILTLAGAISTIFASMTSNPVLSLFIKSCTFPVGLICIIMSGFILYTGSVATFANGKSWVVYLIKLAIAWLGNLLGALFFSTIIYVSLGDTYAASFVAIAEAKCALDPLKAAILGFGCNYFLCLGVTVAKNSYWGKVASLFICVFMFTAIGFEHSIANMGYLILGMMNGAAVTVGQAFFYNLLPVTIGNFVGGLLIPLINKATN